MSKNNKIFVMLSLSLCVVNIFASFSEKASERIKRRGLEKLPADIADIVAQYPNSQDEADELLKEREERELAKILGIDYPLYAQGTESLLKPATILGIKNLNDIARVYRDKVFPGGRTIFQSSDLKAYKEDLTPAIEDSLNKKIKKIYDQAKQQLEDLREKRENEARSKPRSLAEPLEIDYSINE